MVKHLGGALLVGLVVASLTACTLTTYYPHALPQEVEGETVWTEAGAPTASFQPHPDGLGWTVSVSRPWRRLVHRVLQDTGREVVWSWSPFPIGLSVLNYLVDLNRLQEYVRTWDCPGFGAEYEACFQRGGTLVTAHMAMVGYLPRQYREIQRTVPLDPVETEAVGPVMAATVRLTLDHVPPLFVEYPLDGQGQAGVRLAHLAEVMRQEGVPLPVGSVRALTLQVDHHGTSVQTWPLSVAAIAFQAAQNVQVTAAPLARWPRVVTLSLGGMTGLTPAEQMLVRSRILEHAQRLSLPVTSEGTRGGQAVVHEQVYQHTGRVADDLMESVSPWDGGTVLLSVVWSAQTWAHTLSLTLTDAQQGSVLAATVLDLGPLSLTHALPLIAPALTAFMAPVQLRLQEEANTNRVVPIVDLPRRGVLLSESVYAGPARSSAGGTRRRP